MKILSERKKFIDDLKAITGEHPVYTGMPRCAYTFRGIAVEKDGSITLSDDADMTFLESLITGGLITRDEEVSQLAEEVAPQPEEAEVAGIEEEVSEYVAALDHQPEEEEAAEELLTDDRPNRPRSVQPTISFPLNRHKANSICNLIFTIYSRGKLISKSTGGDFYASEELVEKLQRGLGCSEMNEVLSTIREAGPDALHGLSFKDDKVNFTGFPETEDSLCINAWTALAALINKNAIKQHHVRPKIVDDSNEKFALRTWLTRIGMNGSDLKAERNVLYKNLSDHTAFRNPEAQQKWIERRKND